MTPTRRAIPLSVKLDVALRALGLHGIAIDWSHEPALELRAINDEGTDWKPPQHDPAYIFIRRKAEHAEITFKDNGTGRGDLTAIAHSKRLVQSQHAHGARMAAKMGAPLSVPVRAKPAIPSRGFSKQHRPLRSRSDLKRRRT